MSAIEFNNILIHQSEFLKPFAINLTRDPESARDLYQETIYKALANREKYNAGTNIKAWLYTIMRNIFINDYRRKVKQRTVFDASPNDWLINHQQAITRNAGESDLQIKEIRQAIHGLPEIFRTPFLLYFEGYKYQEIATEMKEPLGTIKSRIHFARKLLREQFSRY